MHVGIIGATGFLGRHLCQEALKRGWHVTGFSRQSAPRLEFTEKPRGSFHWRAWSDQPQFDDLDIIVNLAGASIATRWSEKAKAAIRSSRLQSIEAVKNGLEALPRRYRPKLVLNAGATGIYGDRGDEWLDENSAPGEGYLARLCQEWELRARELGRLVDRVAISRTGMVIAPDGGALARMLPAFRLGLGAVLGTGEQWMPTIAVEELISAWFAVMADPEFDGPFNAVSPEILRNREWTDQLAASLGKPRFLRIPAWALRLGLGEMSSLLLCSQRVRPARLLAAGWRPGGNS